MASVLVHLPDGAAPFDPDPAATTKRGLNVVSEWDDSVIGIVGWSDGGLAALRSAISHPEVERLALVSTPYPDVLPADVTELDSVVAKTLLLFGSLDPATGSRHGRAWKKHLANARLEMVPKGGHDLLVPMWGRVLSHLAPGRSR